MSRIFCVLGDRGFDDEPWLAVDEWGRERRYGRVGARRDQYPVATRSRHQTTASTPPRLLTRRRRACARANAYREIRFEKRIYIPLPDVEARKRMFELNVGSTPCQLSQKDYRKLAEMTEG